ncbi:MAG: hypothetical protein JWM05_1032, partial [Acidimicrobiales bacterium]|nr:hypothetical protein [Acidimicrobiales bacterium]
MPLLDPGVLAALRTSLPEVAERTVAAVTDEVPNYAASLGPAMGANIQDAVQAALEAFLRRVSRAGGDGAPAAPAAGLDAAYALGRGEARTGRA